MGQCVLVSGASGFVGRAVCRALIERGHRVMALVRRIESAPPGTEPRVGDILDPASLDRATAGAESVIHLVGIIMEDRRRGITFDRVHVEGTRIMLDATRRSNVRRFVHMSALGTRENAVARYHQTKWQAECLVRESALDFTIFRPSLIHGPGGEFTKMLADWSRMRRAPWLFMPYFGRGLLGFGGAGLLQPIHVDDVARSFVDAIDANSEIHRTSVNQTIDLAGPERLTWPELHRTASRAIVGRRRLVLPLPVWWARILTSIIPEHILGTNRSQVEMSQEDNTADFDAVVRAIGFRPRDFSTSIAEYAKSL